MVLSLAKGCVDGKDNDADLQSAWPDEDGEEWKQVEKQEEREEKAKAKKNGWHSMRSVTFSRFFFFFFQLLLVPS